MRGALLQAPLLRGFHALGLKPFDLPPLGLDARGLGLGRGDALRLRARGRLGGGLRQARVLPTLFRCDGLQGGVDLRPRGLGGLHRFGGGLGGGSYGLFSLQAGEPRLLRRGGGEPRALGGGLAGDAVVALFSLRRDFGARALGSNRVLQRQGADLAFRDGFPQQGDASPRQPSSHEPLGRLGRAVSF